MAMVIVLLMFSVLVALGGFASLSEATTGVGLICLACLLGIYARIFQADNLHRQHAKPRTPPQP